MSVPAEKTASVYRVGPAVSSLNFGEGRPECRRNCCNSCAKNELEARDGRSLVEKPYPEKLCETCRRPIFGRLGVSRRPASRLGRRWPTPPFLFRGGTLLAEPGFLGGRR